MDRKFYSLLAGVILTLSLVSCVSTKTYTENSIQNETEEFITISGKNGVYFEGIDGESFPKTRSIKLTEGPHVLRIGVEKGSKLLSGKITTTGYFFKRIYAVKGNNMCIEAVIQEKGHSTTMQMGSYSKTITLLDVKYVYRLDTTEQLGTTKKIFSNPEKFEVEDCPKEIEFLSDLPTDRKFIIVGNLKTELSGVLFNYTKLKDETVYKAFLYDAYSNNIDALVDAAFFSNPSFYSKSYSGLGIRYID